VDEESAKEEKETSAHGEAMTKGREVRKAAERKTNFRQI